MFVDLSASKSLPQPPFIIAEDAGIYNFRDIGGYPIKNHPSLSVRRGFFFRGSEPSAITPEGEKQLRALGIKTIFDIRTKYEIGEPSHSTDNEDTEKNEKTNLKWLDTQIKDIEGIKRVHIDPSEADDPDGSAIKKFMQFPKFTTERFIAKIRPILDRGLIYRPIFDHLLQPSPSPFMVHCTAGKDRTGVIVMLFQSLSGVPRELLVEEYALSDQGMRGTAPEIVKRLTRDPRMPMPDDWATQLVLAKREYMEALVDILEKEHGGVERYLSKQLGLGKKELERIRRNLVVEEKPIFATSENREVSTEHRKRHWLLLGFVVGCVFSVLPLVRNHLPQIT